MPCIAKDPPRGISADGSQAVCLAANASDTAPNSAPSQTEILRNPRAVREARHQLNLEFLQECAGGIRIHAELVQTFAEIGDPAGVCYALKRLFAHAKAAQPVFTELRDGLTPNEETRP
jgi:hypothetical protein